MDGSRDKKEHFSCVLLFSKNEVVNKIIPLLEPVNQLMHLLLPDTLKITDPLNHIPTRLLILVTVLSNIFFQSFLKIWVIDTDGLVRLQTDIRHAIVKPRDHCQLRFTAVNGRYLAKMLPFRYQC